MHVTERTYQMSGAPSASTIQPEVMSEPPLRPVVVDAIDRLGLRETAKRLCCTTESLCRIAAGLTVRRGTEALIRARMQLLDGGAR
jgi:hypothetical protein